ncbi:MAG TPA: hypothetical protein VK527_10105, partial [Candidatus Limnocylindrales bacterium]|nr:hypothetical protein [Candidatus Limnocylindrales bacterium]
MTESFGDLGAWIVPQQTRLESKGGFRIVILPSARLAAGQNSWEGWAFERAFKRALDLTSASLGILILAPACLLIAIAVKLDTRGP